MSLPLMDVVRPTGQHRMELWNFHDQCEAWDKFLYREYLAL